MAHIIFGLLFLIPAMFGLAEILHILKLYILKPNKQLISYKLIVLTNDLPVIQMKYNIEQFLWNGRKNSAKLIFINSFLNHQNFVECKTLAEKYAVSFCSTEDLKKYIDFLIE